MQKTLLMAAVAALATGAVWAAEAPLPDGFKGFRGLLKGTILSKTDKSFVLKVDAVVKTFPANKAKKAEEIVGKEVTIQVRNDRLLSALKERSVGERVEAGALNEQGTVVMAIEQIKGFDTGAATNDVSKLQARVAELEKQVAALKAENEELRKQLTASKGAK